jgi:hypothetical protein
MRVSGVEKAPASSSSDLIDDIGLKIDIKVNEEHVFLKRSQDEESTKAFIPRMRMFSAKRPSG